MNIIKCPWPQYPMDFGTNDVDSERNASTPASSKGGWEAIDLAQRLSIPEVLEKRIHALGLIVERVTKRLSQKAKERCEDIDSQPQQHPQGEKHQAHRTYKPVQTRETPKENPDVDQELSPAQVGLLLKPLVCILLLVIAGIITTLVSLLSIALVEFIVETCTGPAPAEMQTPTEDELGTPRGYVAVMDELDFDEAKTRKLLKSLEKWDRVNYLLVNEDLGSVLVSFSSKTAWLRATQQHQEWASREPLRSNGETIRMIPFGSYKPRLR
ncbi:hypothetical protein VMCG_04827 [Cytospora schulzeri]|uniref:Uncharacterized protein n=1 Tax=Cytospora schulzeri TaxID=448051 RepID=A0A423WN36_9PEZI|nr:hypothetical protein VMCG_04827 [Valsa malicola]